MSDRWMDWFWLVSLDVMSFGVLSCVGVTSTVKASLHESLMQILSPRRRVDILRDVMESKKKGKPYVVTFCGVNGVGKSTNLAKVFLLHSS